MHKVLEAQCGRVSELKNLGGSILRWRKSEKAMAPHSSTLAWKIPWMEEPGRLQSMGSLRVAERLHSHFSLSCNAEGNGNPLQSSCLENPRDWGAWWAAVYGVTQSRTRLKRLSSSSRSSVVRYAFCILTPLILSKSNEVSSIIIIPFYGARN